MDFRRIRHFVHTVELGSLSKAAERLHIVQPALTQSIKRLEADLGVLLFTRSRRGMELTEAGRMFLKSAYGILNQYHRAKENISAIGSNPQGRVSVAMTASALHVLSVPLGSDLQANYPGIELNIEEGLAANIQHGFEAGWYDLVISYMVKPDDAVHIEDLIEEELFLTSPYRTGAVKSDIRFRDLRNYPLIMPHDQHGVGASVQQIARDMNVKLSAAHITGALHPTIQLVEAGFGNSLLPWCAIHDRVAKKSLVARRVVSPRIRHTVSMVYPAHRPLAQATITVMNVIRRAMLKVHNEGKWPGRILLAKKQPLAQIPAQPPGSIPATRSAKRAASRPLKPATLILPDADT